MEHIVIAHRGLSGIAPENTAPAFTAMAEKDVQWLETDIDITKDGELVLLHDNSVNRTTNGRGNLHELSYHDVQQLDAGKWFNPTFAGTTIMPLTDLIQLINQDHLHVNFELKAVFNSDDQNLAGVLLQKFTEALKLIDPASEIIVSSFNPKLLAQFKALNPATATAILFEDAIPTNWLEVAQAVQAEYIHPDAAFLTAAQVAEFTEQGFRTNVWTVNTQDKASELFSWGVHGVFTDFAHELTFQPAFI
ncbi:glycerophosphoryl diester phosphodiesterase [Periweissella cryptocerci]|uniref:Glycerophosphoryl diester phosphodiesterase n=1 Tax=Periweissella cryptocerci TaxID=2506420 RepID=A0A4P6YR55_9LACO|nr:glycerophosphodiester phosphodiesterase family protein [Periweissella cryptocerci]QBO35091.1 glycerophosphoryl diester phosphodiesterase [Periweissella cryptocerci]